MKIACTNKMLVQTELTEQADFLKEMGFDGIAVFADYDSFNDRRFNELSSIQKKIGIEVCEFCFSGEYYGNLMSSDYQLRERSRKMYREAIEVCNSIGAVTEMEFECCAQKELPLFHPYLRMSEYDKSSFMELFSRLAETLKPGAKLLLEPLNRYEARYLNTVEDCAEAVLICNNSGVGLLADTFHMSIEEQNIEKSIIAYGNMIYHVHLGDSNRLLPGNGRLDWKKVLGAIKKYGNNQYISLECAIGGDQKAELIKTIKFLRRLLEIC